MKVFYSQIFKLEIIKTDEMLCEMGNVFLIVMKQNLFKKQKEKCRIFFYNNFNLSNFFFYDCK